MGIEGQEGLKIEESASLIIRHAGPIVRKPRGRPVKFKRDMIRDAELLAGLGFTEKDFVAYWRIDRSTFYRWKKKDGRELCDAVERGRLSADITATKQLWSKVEGGNLDAIKYWLAKRRPEYWGDKTQGDINISNAISMGPRKEKESEMRDRVKSFTKEEDEEFRKIWEKVKAETKKENAEEN